MSGELRLLNRQRTRSFDGRFLRRILRHLLIQSLAKPDFDLTVHLISGAEMTRLNETALRHAGSTDVITFDYSDANLSSQLVGEIFVCVDEAVIQARRYRVDWPVELTRYLIHGLLHMSGHDDTSIVARRRMKREEGRRLRELAREFGLSKLRRKPRVAG